MPDDPLCVLHLLVFAFAFIEFLCAINNNVYLLHSTSAVRRSPLRFFLQQPSAQLKIWFPLPPLVPISKNS
jgi:hypothetical protein